MVTLLASQPDPERPVASDPTAEARAVDAALHVVSRFAPVRRIQHVADADQPPGRLFF